MIRTRLWAALACPLLLTACGGHVAIASGSGGTIGSGSGGNGSGSGGSGNSGFDPSTLLSNSQTSELDSQQTVALATDHQGTLQRAANASSPSFNIHYDAASKTYFVASGAGSQSFGASSQSGTNSGADGSQAYVAYHVDSGSTTDDLTLFTKPASATGIVLSYTNFGRWQRNAGNSQLANDWFVYGTQTATTDMPRTGTASYALVGQGSYATATNHGDLDVSGTLTANFGSGSVNLALNLSGTTYDKNHGSLPTSLSGSTAINGSAYSGSFSNAASGFAGAFNGAFFGRGAKETGSTFAGSSASGVLSGAVVGAQK